MIWDYVLVESHGIQQIDMLSDEVSSERQVDHPVRPLAVDFGYDKLNILAVCKSIYAEAKPVFWSKSTFVFAGTRDLDHFLKQRTIDPARRLLTNFANVQHVRLANDDIYNVRHMFRERVLTRLANGDNIVSLVIQHGEKWPCWCERCLDVQELFDVVWDEQQAEREAEARRIKELEEKHEGGLEEILAENEEAMVGYEDLFADD